MKDGSDKRASRARLLRGDRTTNGKPCRWGRWLTAFVLLWSARGIGLAASSPGFPGFAVAQSERHYTRVPHQVLAFYYPWYGQPEREGWQKADTNTQHIANTARYPARGPYSSHDPELIDWQIETARSNGITGFIVSWWGVGAWESWIDQALPLLLERSEKQGFKIALYWEQAPGARGQDQIDRAVSELTYVLTHYGRSAAFLKVNGQPVIFVYGRVLSQVPAASWPAIIQGTRDRAGDFVLIADGYQQSYACFFDGLHDYNFSAQVQGKSPDQLREWASDYYADAVGLARRHGKISCVTVIPGYDDRKIREAGFQVDRRNGETWRVLWREAVKAEPDWILITTWNEWYEGTEIEPSAEAGDQYLRLTREFAPAFLASAPLAVAAPAGLSRFVPGTTRLAGELLAGKRVGLLPDHNFDREFWLLYCGATVHELSWTNLVDPTEFNVRRLPLVVHNGGERYRSTVQVTDDVTRALIRYLGNGGFLVSIPREPWPFYYDDSRGGKPFPITDRLRLGVTGEEPSAWLGLRFTVNTNALPGLPASVPYPVKGDLRLRPAVRTRVPSYDIYRSLVDLRDGRGRTYGDAVAYIEHRTLPLSPGRTLYVAMRAPDAFGAAHFYPVLFDFIAAKLKPAP